MGHRLTRIYTRTGDSGTSGLGDGSRVDKDSPRMEALGAVDELNSAVGVVLAQTNADAVSQCLQDVQHDLFELGGELSMPGHDFLSEQRVEALEAALNRFNAELPDLKEFILPGGAPGAASCHLARSVCRRAERRLVSLARVESVNPPSMKYLNRLSDLLFVIARTLARAEGGEEVLWNRQR